MNPRFLASELQPISESKADFSIIPCPMEYTTSYGRGTKDGPLAILTASNQLELNTYASKNIHTKHTAGSSHVRNNNPEEILTSLESIRASVFESYNKKALPVLLGGEHTATLGALNAIDKKFGAENVTIIHLDAHMDLRASYRGRVISHATVMRRAHELGFNIHQIGVREFSEEENDFVYKCTDSVIPSKSSITQQSIDVADSTRPFIQETSLRHPGKVGGLVYLSIDVDVLDMSIMPATGTPSPGGLKWETLKGLINSIAFDRTVIGFDVMEFSPINNFHCYDFLAAKIVYEAITNISSYSYSRKSQEQREKTNLRIYGC